MTMSTILILNLKEILQFNWVNVKQSISFLGLEEFSLIFSHIIIIWFDLYHFFLRVIFHVEVPEWEK